MVCMRPRGRNLLVRFVRLRFVYVKRPLDCEIESGRFAYGLDK